MINYEWPAQDYAIGNYIQATIANQYLNLFATKPTDYILDIGCGDGSFSTSVVERVPEGGVLGIDRSANMLAVAREKMTDYPNLSLQQTDVLMMDFSEQFNQVVSFWCLHWCPDLATAYMKIYGALKKGGRVLTIFPTGNCALMRGIQSMIATHEFPQLRHFKLSVDFEQVGDLPKLLTNVPFKNAQVDIKKHVILLPSLDIYRKFVCGLALFQGQVPEDEISVLNEALVKAYDLECQQKYQGKYWFDISIFLVTAEK